MTKKRGLVEYYSLATCFYDNGKNQKKIIFGIGELSKEQAETYRLFLSAINEQVDSGGFVDIESLVFEDDKQYLDVLAMNAIWTLLGFDKIFSVDLSNGQRLSTEHVARILTINRLLHPSSKIRTVEWLKGTLLPEIMGIDGQAYDRNKVFRELTPIHHAKEKLEKLFWRYSKKEKRKYDVYYFDGSTSWFEGSRCPLAEADLEKTRGFFPKVLGLMLITDTQGFPVAWEVVNGHAKDTTKLKDFVERITNDFGIKEITYCFDRGVASASNFDLITSCKSKYISAIRDNQIKEVFDLERFKVTRIKITDRICGEKTPVDDVVPKRRIVDIDSFFSSDENVFFREIGIVDGKRYVVSFNYERFIREHNERQSRIEQALLEVAEKNKDLRKAPRDRDYNATERDLLGIFSKHRVRLYFGYKLLPLISEKKAQSFKIECQIDNSKIESDKLTDGLLVFITDHLEKKANQYDFMVSAADIVAHYKGKHVVENAFRELKSFIEFRPIFVWTTEHVKAHYDISIIACFINNYINVKIRPLEKSLRDFHAHLKKAGRVAQLVAPSGLEVFKLKKVSAETKDYFDKLNIKDSLSPKLHRCHSVSQ